MLAGWETLRLQLQLPWKSKAIWSCPAGNTIDQPCQRHTAWHRPQPTDCSTVNRGTPLSSVGRIGPPAAPRHTLLSITGPQQATQALQAPAAAGKMARLALGSLVLVLLLAAARAEERSFRATVVSPEAGQ